MTVRELARPSRPVRIAGALAIASGLDVAVDPERTHLPLCPLHALTGWQCPLCGGLRAVDHLLHGQLAAALHDNALVVAAAPVLALLLLVWFRADRAGRPAPRLSRPAVVASVVLLVAFGVIRNLPAMAALRP